MNGVTRRKFLGTMAATGMAAGFLAPTAICGDEKRVRKMTIDLVCGAIGVSANQREAIDLASRHGFESVEASGGFLAALKKEELEPLLEEMKGNKVVFGAAGLPVDFRQDTLRFQDGLRTLPRIAAGLERAGVSRVGTWISPNHAELTYLQNFKRHAERLKEVAVILNDHGQRLGLEYVGTQTLRNSRKFPFIHTMAETRELIAEIGVPGVGFVVDSWHWWTAGETEADLLTLKNEEIVAADLNDAPAGIPREEQRDNRRELPMATGVIDTGVFLNALNKVGYDGPVRAEPFNQALNALPKEEACAVTIVAMRNAFALIR
jgi:sugar phosphate isomerase/epimerase